VARAGMKKLSEIFEITSFLKSYEIVDILLVGGATLYLSYYYSTTVRIRLGILSLMV